MSPLLSQSVLEQIRMANDIVGVIGAYFQLKRSGSAFKALCPFHKEKTPSFMVNPQRQIFHCFGCGAGGDVFRFVMNYEKVDFMTAVKMLAAKANIRLAFESGTEESRMAKDILYEIVAGAARLFHGILLNNPEAQAARDYLRSRAINRKTAEEFMIGFAPDSYDTVIRWAGKKYQRTQLEAAGLVMSSAGRQDGGENAQAGHWYDRFRNRVMFAIRDEQGRAVGFSGRVMQNDPQAAKYINTPETALFHKGRLLYALDTARRAIIEQHEAIVCEGQIDVIRCHLSGFSAAVAAQGTAFTDDHARILKRYADGVILAFDADNAGQKAALRATEVFLRAGLGVRVASLPEGTDPDSLLLQEGGPEKFREILDRAQSVIDFQIDTLGAEAKSGTEAALMRISAAVLNTIAQAADPVLRSAMLKTASSRLGLAEDTLAAELGKRERRPRAPEPVESAPAGDNLPQREMALLEHLLHERGLAALVKKHLPPDLLTHAKCRQLVELCQEADASGRDVMAIISEKDDQERSLSTLAAAALGAPRKIKSDFATHEESVKALILALRRDALQKQRHAIELKLQGAKLAAAGADGAATRQLEIEYSQIGYDLVKMRRWDTALPILELMQ
ncbi:MAG: DNA primase [Kiritimatiellia bacterium]